MNRPNMALVAIVFGVLLIIQGLAFWMATGFEPARFTAAIPGFFGVAADPGGGFGAPAFDPKASDARDDTGGGSWASPEES